MEASPAKFLFGFLFVSIILWLLFIFASRLVAWLLSRVMGASVEFRVSGWKCLRDVNVKFKKGAIESVSVGEIRLSVRQSLVKLGVGFMSKDPKLQVLICDLEIVTRASKKKSTQKTKSQRSRTSGRGKWMVVANVARFLSVCITDLVVKTPKATLEVKELTVDISKDGGSKPALFVKLHLVPIYAHLGESRVISDQALASSSYSCSQTLPTVDKSSAPFSCEEFSLLCEFGHDRYAGIVMRNLDITNGEVSVNLDDTMFLDKSDAANTFLPIDGLSKTSSEPGAANMTHRKQQSSATTKYASMFPEKFSFTLPKLDVKFVHREHGIVIDNNIMGIEMRTVKSQISEDVGDSMRLDMQMEFREIHLFRGAGISVVEIMKLDVIASAYLPLQPATPIRSEIDIKLGGTQFNLIVSRFVPLLKLRSLGKRKVARSEGSLMKEKSRSTEHKNLMWTCTVSAPEMTLVLYSLNGQPLYHCCSQSSHVFANNISSTGASVHMELGELNLYMSDEYQECLRESLFGVETNTGSLAHIAKINLDWGKKDMDLLEDSLKLKSVLSVDVSGMGICLTFKRLDYLISTSLSFKDNLKKFSSSYSSKKTSQELGVKSSRTPKNGIQLLNINLEKCSVNLFGEVGLEAMDMADPKRVNFGSQGGRTTISVSADGTPRTAYIMSTLAGECKKMKYSASLDIFHLSFSMNMEKKSNQMDIRRARSVYQELLEGSNPDTKVTLIDMQNAKFVRRSGGVKEISVCSLFSATDISARWEPDVHIALVELGLHVKSLIYKYKLQGLSNEVDLSSVRDDEHKEKILGSGTVEKQKKRESIFAVDVEMLRISAEVGDGVETLVQVQSIFSENARIGVLLEGILLDLNGARILRSSRMQISRVPSTASNVPTVKSEMARVWDWVIQALDVHICMPYRLQLRAIDDSVEEMLRALKLIVAAKTHNLYPINKESAKTKKSTTSGLGCLRFCIRKLTAEIEEEPLQGWLDEHYQLLKNEACEVAVRCHFLDELISKGAEKNDLTLESKICYNGEEIDSRNTSAIKRLQDEIYKESFRSYYQACQNLKPSEGSGACKVGFQAGFKPSTNRTSILSLSATELDVTLTRIEGGDAGMIEVVQKLDPVSRAHNIPFARLYGGNLILNTGSLVVQLRNYTYPLFSGTSGRCEGRLVLAQQATCFQPQVYQNVYFGKWRKVRMLRSASGTTPPIKTYLDLPLHFQKGEICYGVGFEPLFTDISYAFTVALRRANLSTRNSNPDPFPPKKEKSLPWWDEMRNYIHGNTTLFFSETRWNILATTDPYEKSNKLQILSGPMEIRQSDGCVYTVAKDFRVFLSSLESLLKNYGFKPVSGFSIAFLEVPMLTVEVTMDWECESGNPLNHYLFSLPNEGKTRKKIYDPFRSTSLSLRWNLSLRPSLPSDDNQSQSYAFSAIESENKAIVSPTMNSGPQDLAWLIRFWNLNYIPPNKLRTFSRWPRFGVPRVPRSGNLSLDKVMTEFMFRVDSTPACIRHMPLDDDDPAKGLTFKMNKLKYEMYLSRGKQKFTFECKRELLDFVYQGVDLHMPKAFIDRDHCPSVAKLVQLNRKAPHCTPLDGEKSGSGSGSERPPDDGFLLSSEYFTIRRQAPKADPERLLSWQEAGRRNLELTYVRSEFENGSESDDHARSDPSDDDGYNVVIADNCQRIFVYGLKLLWTLENRDAVWSWVGGLSKAFEPSKPSPSRQYAQRKLLEEKKTLNKMSLDDNQKTLSMNHNGKPSLQEVVDSSRLQSSPPKSAKVDSSSFNRTAKLVKFDDTEGEGTRHFMVNVIEPQFNLHSEEASGRFLLAAVSGRVLARSFHSVLQVGKEVIEQALGSGNVQIPESHPEMTWNRMEFSVMLEHVQAHVAPTDVDPGAGLQWLPKIRRSSPKVKRTGALLERVFMPCDMYFRYTRHKGGTSDLKVKPLKELTFNSHNITATMTSRQFQVMLDVLTNLLFARLPKPRKNSLAFSTEDDEDVGEEADEVVPDGVEEVELARVDLEHRERGHNLILEDIRNISSCTGSSIDQNLENDSDLWMITGGRPLLIKKLKKELASAKVSRRAASACLRMALQKAAQLRLSEKEKNKSPSYAMRISLQINKVVWGMLVDGKSFAEAEISDMTYDFDRDYKDVGVARFTTKYFVVRNCLPSAKSDMLLSAWNPPPEWGKKVMLRVDSKQGAPKDGNSPLELFEVEIYPLKIHLTEIMYRMMWEYFFPEEEQDSQRRQEVWKVSTTAGLKRIKKGSSSHDSLVLSSQSAKDYEVLAKSSTSCSTESSQASRLANLKPSVVSGSKPEPEPEPELRRTSSFGRTWEEKVAESVVNELVLQAHSSSSKSSSFACLELPDEPHKSKPKESKLLKPGRASHEEKKVGKTQDDKKSRPRRLREFHNIKISQVELLVTYEGSRFAVSDLRLLMDTFHRVEFVGTWRRLFSRVKKHIIWGVLKSVTGMQGKKFKDKAHNQSVISNGELNLSDSDGGAAEKSDQYPTSWPKRPGDGAGDGFVTSIRGLFNSQRRKAKAFVLRTMRGEAENELHGDWSESEAEFSPFARQLTITKAKRLIRRHTKKFRSRGHKGSSSQQRESLPSSPRETFDDSDSSGESSPYEDFLSANQPGIE